MKASDNAILLIKHFEGCRLKAYYGDDKKWTIGWGNTFFENGTPVKAGDFIGQARADRLLLTIVAEKEKIVNKAVKVKIPQSLFDALVSWTYNLGKGRLQSSTMLKLINEEAPLSEVMKELRKWEFIGKNKSDGLTRRRKSEEHLATTGEINFFEL